MLACLHLVRVSKGDGGGEDDSAQLSRLTSTSEGLLKTSEVLLTFQNPGTKKILKVT